MNEQQKLTLKMALLFLVVFVFFGVIIVKEKFDILFIPKVEKKFDTYLQDNYMSIYSSLKKNKINYKNDVFTLKVTSSQNKNLFFYLTYTNKKIKDTYQKDYIEGNSLLNHIEKSIEKDVLTKTNEEVEISIDTNLDEFAKTVKDKIINTNSSAYSTLKIYTLKKEILTKKFSSKEITESILSFTSLLKKNNITPKAYSFTIINEDDLTKTISLDNLTEDNLEYNYLSSLIQTKLN